MTPGEGERRYQQYADKFDQFQDANPHPCPCLTGTTVQCRKLLLTGQAKAGQRQSQELVQRVCRGRNIVRIQLIKRWRSRAGPLGILIASQGADGVSAAVRRIGAKLLLYLPIMNVAPGRHTVASRAIRVTL